MSIKTERALELKSTQSKITEKYIEKAQRGNSKAMKVLYEQYSKAMFNICVRMSNSFEDAEDILQEAFTDAFLNINSYNFEASFGSWIKRIVINKCINALKKKKVDIVLTDKDETNLVSDEVDYGNINFQVEQVHNAIAKLPEGYKVVCSLYLLEGYDHKEIAQILNIAESTSKSQYMRAKKKLIELIKVNHG